MKKTIEFLIFFVFLFFVISITTNVFAGQPKLLIPETTFDYGYAPTKTMVTHYYLIKNVGTDSLKITNVKPG